jgi:PIN domain nuclease of toxin-antitoxin system
MADAIVLDASALLAALDDEPGAAEVEALLERAVMSAVNYAEVVTKLNERGANGAEIDEALAEINIPVIDFDSAQARACGLLRGATKAAGLSLGDRACLTLAQARGGRALTADRAWANLGAAFVVGIVR